MKVRYTPNDWKDVAGDGWIEGPEGRLRMRTIAPCGIIIESNGVEVVAGYGTQFDLQISEPYRVRVEPSTRAAVYSPHKEVTETVGEVFTNIDRMPFESGNLLEVTKALRQIEIEKRAFVRQIRAERAQLEALKKSVKEPAQALPREPEERPDEGLETPAEGNNGKG